MSFFQTSSDTDFEKISAEVGFILDLQLAIEHALDERGLTQADLARLMNVSEPRVSQMLSDNGANMRARTIGRIADALNATPCLKFEPRDEAGCAVSMKRWAVDGRNAWGRAVAANENQWEREGTRMAAGAR